MAMMNFIPGFHAVYSPWIGSMQVSICRIQSVPLIFEQWNERRTGGESKPALHFFDFRKSGEAGCLPGFLGGWGDGPQRVMTCMGIGDPS